MGIVSHVTERDSFKFCRRMWRYQNRDNLLPKTEKRSAMWLGRGIHFGLAEYYRTGLNPWDGFKDWLSRRITPEEYDALWESEKTEIADISALAETMLTNYVPFAQQNDDFEIVAVEEPIKIRVPGSYNYLVGTLDLVVRRNGKLWVIDHKSYASLVGEQDLELDDQMTAYLWLVWQKYGEMPAGAIYNQLRKKIPCEPMMLVSGKSFSKAKGIDTTPEKFRAAVEREGFDPADYAELLSTLEHNEFYRRTPIARSAGELKNFSRQLSGELRDMASKSLAIYPYAKRDCSWGCSYKMLCKCENEGGDLEALIDTNYQVVEGRQE